VGKRSFKQDANVYKILALADMDNGIPIIRFETEIKNGKVIWEDDRTYECEEEHRQYEKEMEEDRIREEQKLDEYNDKTEKEKNG